MASRDKHRFHSIQFPFSKLSTRSEGQEGSAIRRSGSVIFPKVEVVMLEPVVVVVFPELLMATLEPVVEVVPPPVVVAAVVVVPCWPDEAVEGGGAGGFCSWVFPLFPEDMIQVDRCGK